jgi:hypothetical protein
MTRYDIALKKNPFEAIVVSRKTVVLKKCWPVYLEKSPCSATCHTCKGTIPAKTIRFKTWFVHPGTRFSMTRLYHEHCLPNDMIEIIKKKENLHGSNINGRSVQKIRSGQ